MTAPPLSSGRGAGAGLTPGGPGPFPGPMDAYLGRGNGVLLRPRAFPGADRAAPDRTTVRLHLGSVRGAHGNLTATVAGKTASLLISPGMAIPAVDVSFSRSDWPSLAIRFANVDSSVCGAGQTCLTSLEPVCASGLAMDRCVHSLTGPKVLDWAHWGCLNASAVGSSGGQWFVSKMAGGTGLPHPTLTMPPSSPAVPSGGGVAAAPAQTPPLSGSVVAAPADTDHGDVAEGGGSAPRLSPCDPTSTSQRWKLSPGVTPGSSRTTNLICAVPPPSKNGKTGWCISIHACDPTAQKHPGMGPCKALPTSGCAKPCACNTAWSVHANRTITSAMDGQCLTAIGWYANRTTDTQMQICNGKTSQQFDVTTHSDGSQSFANGGACLDSAPGAGPAPGPPGPPNDLKYVTFRLTFHHVDRFELDLRGDT